MLFCVSCVATVNACTEERVANVQWRVIVTLTFKERCLYGQSLPGTRLRRSMCSLQLSRWRAQPGEACHVNYCVGLIISVTAVTMYVKSPDFVPSFIRFGTSTALTEDSHAFPLSLQTNGSILFRLGPQLLFFKLLRIHYYAMNLI